MKKKAVSISISVVLAIVLILVAIIASGFKYKDLGVRYDGEDIKNMADNIGLTVDNAENGETLEETIARLREEGKKIGVDYTIEYSNYTDKTFELTQSEATAMLNELMPSLSFLSKTQFKLNGGGKIEISTALESQRALDLVVPGKQIDMLPEYVNFAAAGSAYIKDNVIYFTTDSMESPILEYIATSTAPVLKGDISKVFSNTPELYISDMHQTENGTISITGTVPQNIKIIEFQAPSSSDTVTNS